MCLSELLRANLYEYEYVRFVKMFTQMKLTNSSALKSCKVRDYTETAHFRSVAGSLSYTGNLATLSDILGHAMKLSGTSPTHRHVHSVCCTIVVAFVSSP